MILRFVIAALVVLTLPCSNSWAAPVNEVSAGLITGTGLITFEDLAGGPEPGTNYDGIVRSGNVSFAERFAGQTNTPTPIGGDPFLVYDVLSGVPSAPLSLAVGAANQNLGIESAHGLPSGQALYGLSPCCPPEFFGFPNALAIGEGSFAVLFDFDQSQFSFDLVGVGGSPGFDSAFVSFFRRDGSLIDTKTLPIIVFGVQSQGFIREGDVKDIAGFSVYNTDSGGLLLDNLRYELFAVPVPAPAAGPLLGIGVLLVALRKLLIGSRGVSRSSRRP